MGSAPAIAAPPAAGSAKAPAPELARLSYVERNVEQGTSGAWREAREGTPLRIGDRVRTAKDALLRIDFPWMAVTVSPSSSVTFPDEYVLAAVLEEGRVALQADARAILKLVTGEAAVRGQGQVVVRRQARTTLVTALAGTFFVEGAGRAVTLAAGTGTVVRAGQAPLAPLALPERPDGLDPGTTRRARPPSTVSVAGRWSDASPPAVVAARAMRGNAATHAVRVAPARTAARRRERPGSCASGTWPGTERASALPTTPPTKAPPAMPARPTTKVGTSTASGHHVLPATRHHTS